MGVPIWGRTLLTAILVMSWSAARAQEVRLGPVGGVSILEQRDTSLAHGPLVDEIVTGRTILAGVALDVALTGHDHLGLELLIGPYGNDVERSCINRSLEPPCTLAPFKRVSRGLLYGMYYLRTFGASRWRPLVAGGLGVKRYTYEEFEPENASPTVSAAFGLERHAPHRLRVELRTIIVQDNPLRLGKTQVELQARASWLFSLTR